MYVCVCIDWSPVFFPQMHVVQIRVVLYIHIYIYMIIFFKPLTHILYTVDGSEMQRGPENIEHIQVFIRLCTSKRCSAEFLSINSFIVYSTL